MKQTRDNNITQAQCNKANQEQEKARTHPPPQQEQPAATKSHQMEKATRRPQRDVFAIPVPHLGANDGTVEVELAVKKLVFRVQFQCLWRQNQMTWDNE